MKDRGTVGCIDCIVSKTPKDKVRKKWPIQSIFLRANFPGKNKFI
jgi:hypothetical protein